MACRIFSQVVWDLVPRPGIKRGPLALGGQDLSHWTTKEFLLRLVLSQATPYKILAQVCLTLPAALSYEEGGTMDTRNGSPR